MDTNSHNDELQKGDMGEGEAPTLVEAALGQSLDPASHVLSSSGCSLDSLLFSSLLGEGGGSFKLGDSPLLPRAKQLFDTTLTMQVILGIFHLLYVFCPHYT